MCKFRERIIFSPLSSVCSGEKLNLVIFYEIGY